MRNFDWRTPTEVTETFLAGKKDSWRNNKHRQQWHNTLSKHVYPVIGDIVVGDIDTSHVLQVLDPIWKDKAESARRVRGRIEAILDAAKIRGYPTGKNPTRWRGHLGLILRMRTKLSLGHHNRYRISLVVLMSPVGESRA